MVRSIFWWAGAPLMVAAFVVACSAVGPGESSSAIPPDFTTAPGGPEAGAVTPEASSESCSATQKTCDGKCVALDDPAYGCSATSCTACVVPGGGAACEDGKCALVACAAQMSNCDGDPANGCETNTGTDVASCGACGAGCSFGNASALCKGSVCQLDKCKAGYKDCNADPNDGCETFTNGSVTNCGTCGNECPVVAGKTPKCTLGVCGQSDCSAPLADCDGNLANGCETNTTNDAANCGACGQVCTFARAAASCAGSACVLGACNAGFGNCDNNATNGCETNTKTSIAHCGGCGMPCVVANGTPKCTNSVCGSSGCLAGYADLDGVLGCEYKCPVFPTAVEVCNGKDDNCDGVIDEGVLLTFYRDADGDGYGDPAVTTQACAPPAGYVANKTDCDDTRAAVHPGAAEACNGLDDNCNGVIDDNALDAATFYRDADGDTYGNAAVTTRACSAPVGYVSVAGDCNDASSAVNPGVPDLTVDGVDQNCDGIDGP